MNIIGLQQPYISISFVTSETANETFSAQVIDSQQPFLQGWDEGKLGTVEEE